MLIKVQEPTRHFKAYYQDNSLLIQLMVIELFEIHQHMQLFKSFVNGILRDNIQPMKKCLIHLTGLPEEQVFQPAMSWEKCALLTLKNYCECFFLNLKNQSLTKMRASYYTDQMVAESLHLLNLILLFQKGKINEEKVFKLTQSLIQNFSQNFSLFKNLLLKILRKFHENENVIFFLLRKKDLLNKLFDQIELKKLFNFFTKRNDLIRLLITRFKSRGFDNLLSTIKQELFFYESYKQTKRKKELF